jgi:hypothetical protein
VVGSVIEGSKVEGWRKLCPYPKSSMHHPPAYKTPNTLSKVFKRRTNSPLARLRLQFPPFLFRNQQPVAMDTPRMGRQTSHFKNIPSINDFNTMTHEDMESQFSTSPAVKPVGIVHRSWSVESVETPQRCDTQLLCFYQ